MDDAQDPGTLPVYHEARHAGAAIDDEAPELLSPDQMERHVAAVTEALESYGFEVRARDSREPSYLDAEHRATRSEVELWLHDDRAAEWTTWGEAPEGTTSTELAARVARITGGSPHG